MKLIDWLTIDRDHLQPPSNLPVALNFQFEPTLTEFLKEQKIEFLLVQKPTTRQDVEWTYPSKEQMHLVWNFVKNKLESD